MYNLTENQKEALRWIVQEVRKGNLPEEFTFAFVITGDIHFFGGSIGDLSKPPPISEGTLDALMASDLLLVRKNEGNIFGCTLLGQAYKAVDSNFDDNPDNKNPIKHRSTNKIIAVVLLVLGVVIALVVNVATSTLPKILEPYFWLSWPLLLMLIIVSVVLFLKQ